MFLKHSTWMNVNYHEILMKCYETKGEKDVWKLSKENRK